MRSKRAFTLVELIAVITLLALLLLLTVPSLTGVANNSRVSLRDSKIRTIVSAGEEYGADAINRYQSCVSTNSNLATECTVAIHRLSNTGYLEGDDEDGNVLDPVTNKPLEGNVLLCYDPAHVSIYAHYVDDDNYSCKDIALNSDNTLNLSSVSGIGYIGGDDVTVNMIKSGTFTGYRCKSSDTDFVPQCTIENINAARGIDDKRVRIKISNNHGLSFGGAKNKDVSITVYADYRDNDGASKTLSKEYSLKVFPTELSIIDNGENTCMRTGTTANYELEVLNVGTMSVSSSDKDILEGTAKDGRLYLSSKNKTGHATLTVSESNGKNTALLNKTVYELGLEFDSEKSMDFPSNLVIHNEATVKIKHSGTGNVTISSSDSNVVHFASSKVSESGSITLTDEDSFKVIAVGTGNAKITIRGTECGMEEREISVSSLTFKNENSGIIYIGGENKTAEIVVDYANNIGCTSSNPSAATCSVEATTVVIVPGSVADDDVVLTVGSKEVGFAYYRLKVLKTSLEIVNNRGNVVGTVCREQNSSMNSEQLYATGTNIGKTSIFEIEDWYLAEADIAQEGKERFINVFPRDVLVEDNEYVLGENTGRTRIDVKENNGNRVASFNYNIYSMNVSEDSARLKVDETVEFDVEASGTGEINVATSDENVAVVEIIESTGEFSWTPNYRNKRKIKITAMGTGVATIYIRGADCGVRTFNVTVEGKSLSLVLKPGTYSTGLGADRLTCKTSGLLRTCEVEFPEIYTTSEFQPVGYSKDKDSTSYNYRPGDKITLNLFNNGSTYYGNSMDVTKPVCSIPNSVSNTVIGDTSYVTMTCIDTGSGIRGNGLLNIDNFEVSDSSIGEVTEVGTPIKIANGYSYRLGLRSKKMGFYNVSLKANSVLDEFGNGNDGLSLQNIFSSEYEMEEVWYIGKNERTDVLAVLYDNENVGTGAAGTYSLYIYGRGEMLEFMSSEYSYYSPWYNDYRSNITDVRLNSGLTNVGSGAFYNVTSLNTISLPEGIIDIGDHAFTNCDLTSIVIPNSVVKIEDYAFFGNKNLNDLSIGNGVKTIGIAAFYNHQLTNLRIPSSVESIGKLAFGVEIDRASLSSLIFQKSSRITNIDEMAFIYHRLSTLSLPSSLTNIGNRAFEQGSTDESTLRTVDFGSNSNLRSIGNDAFAYANLASLSLPASLENIGDRAFAAMREGVTSIEIGRNVSSIGDAFAYGKELSSFTVDSGNPYFTAVNGVLYTKDMTTLVKCPDDYYENHDRFDVPNSVRTLQKGAFIGWLDYGTNIDAFDLYLPSTLSEMNIDDNFIFFTIGGIHISNNTYFDSVDGVLYNKDHTVAYRLPTAYENVQFDIPNTVTTVANYFAYGNSRVHSITVPSSVHTIGEMAFRSDTEYGLNTIDLDTDDTVAYDETSFAVMIYPEGADISTRVRTVNVKNTTLKDKLENTYRSVPYKFIVNRV